MKVSTQTKLLGVVGNPVRHSLSPLFQNYMLRKLKINALYLSFEVPKDSFELFMKVSTFHPYLGFNITLPFKERALGICSKISSDAKKIGAVNTVKVEDGKILGFNTDWLGFRDSLKEVVGDLKNKWVLVLGAGGASRAVLYALSLEGAKIYLWNRTLEKAQELAKRFRATTLESLDKSVGDFDVIVNTTSVGLREDDPPLFNYELIRSEQVIYDLIYYQTPLLKVARRKGAKTVSGLKMLVYQGVESFKIWFGKGISKEKIYRYLRRALKY